jgi:hypothetical protein
MKIPAAEELKVGDRVRLWSELTGSADGKNRIVKGCAEYGVVVKTARDNGWQDCYVAFWGFAPHAEREQLGPKPYILRYHYTSLEKLTADSPKKNYRKAPW